MRNYVSRLETYQKYATSSNGLFQKTMNYSYQVHYAESQLALDRRNTRLPYHWIIT